MLNGKKNMVNEFVYESLGGSICYITDTTGLLNLGWKQYHLHVND